MDNAKLGSLRIRASFLGGFQSGASAKALRAETLFDRSGYDKRERPTDPGDTAQAVLFLSENGGVVAETANW